LTAKSQRYLIADLGAVRKKGFVYLLKSEVWPVGEKEFHEFSNYARNLYIKVIKDIDNDDILDIALIETAFVNHLIDIFHYNYVSNYCLKNNIQLVSSKDSNSFINPNWGYLSNYYSRENIGFNKFKGFIRNKVKNLVFNRHLSVWSLFCNIFSKSAVVGIGSNDRVKQEYINNNKLFCDNRDGNELINQALDLFTNNSNGFLENELSDFFSKKILASFFNGLHDSNKSSLFVKGIDFNIIEKTWSNRFVHAYKIYKGLLLIKKPNTLLVTEVGKPFSKIITTVFQKSECKVFNFHHGNDSVLVNQYWTYLSLFGHCKNYVLDTKVMSRRFLELSYTHAHLKSKNINYSSVGSGYYHNLRNKKHTNNYKSIMIMGYPMNLSRHPDDSYHFFHYKLGLEYTIAKKLKYSGYDVIYKAHPDRLNEIKSIMDNVSSKVVEQRFEDIWQEASVLVFTYIPTTTFCYALNLPIPIVFVEMDDTPWYKNMREIVEGRISIIKASMQGNILSVDKNDLTASIKEAQNKVNLLNAERVTG
jgi:hypothetical protein